MFTKKILIIAVWLCIWQAVCDVTGLELLLASPVHVCIALWELVKTSAFYTVLTNSFFHIMIGFFMACIGAVLLGIAAGNIQIVHEFFMPLIHIMKSLPMASFIILLLILFGSSKVSALISFIVVFPMIYNSVVVGMRQTDKKLLEMKQVFSIGFVRTVKYIYLPQMLSYTRSSLKTAFGMSWKAGVSAEVIGLAKNSIGEQLYYAKLYLLTEQLFAWSIVVVTVSFLCENMFFYLLAGLEKRIVQGRIKSTRRSRKQDKAQNGIQDTMQGKIQGKQSIQNPTDIENTDILCVKNIYKKYDDTVVLENISAVFTEGQIHCIMGKSGIGKTTLLKIIMGLLPPDSGEVSKTSKATAQTGKIGVVFQENRLIDKMSAVNNIMLVLEDSSKENEKRIRKLLLDILPKECMDMPVEKLSGGQKRRVAIARALLCECDMYLMDEPFTGLDKESKQKVVQFIKKYTKNKITIIVTHSDMEAKALDSRIYLLTSGNTVATIQ